MTCGYKGCSQEAVVAIETQNNYTLVECSYHARCLFAELEIHGMLDVVKGTKKLDVLPSYTIYID